MEEEEYKLVFTKTFDKYFGKLPKNVQRMVIKDVEMLKQNPKVGKPLSLIKRHRKQIRVWSLKTGPRDSYRVLYQIDKKEKEIYLMVVMHRDQVYEWLKRWSRTL